MNLLKGVEEQENAIENSKSYQEEEAFLNLLRQGKSHKEAYEAIGREKTWASNIIKKIRETEPERLKGTGEKLQEQDMSQTTQKPQPACEPMQLKSTSKEETTEKKANTKPQKQSFSFRADQSKIENWKLYAESIGAKDIGTLWTAAIDEYISNHELTESQQTIYELKKKAVEMQKNQK